MPHDPAGVAETRERLVKAAQDLRAAEVGFAAQLPLTAHVVFHCQQLAEKSLKGFLAWHHRRFRKTHQLAEIGQRCVEADHSLAGLVGRAAPADRVRLEVPQPWPARGAVARGS